MRIAHPGTVKGCGRLGASLGAFAHDPQIERQTVEPVSVFSFNPLGDPRSRDAVYAVLAVVVKC